MGGKGRGVFSDFRLGRVRTSYFTRDVCNTDTAAVPIPNERARWQPAGCEEGKLVRADTRGAFVYYLYIMTRDTSLGGVSARNVTRFNNCFAMKLVCDSTRRWATTRSSSLRNTIVGILGLGKRRVYPDELLRWGEAPLPAQSHRPRGTNAATRSAIKTWLTTRPTLTLRPQTTSRLTNRITLRNPIAGNARST
jgi:hypothetical protein